MKIEILIKYKKTVESGERKNVSESFLVEDAISFSEAETKLTEYINPYVEEGLVICSMRRVDYCEIFRTGLEFDDKWYRIKAQTVVIDEKRQVEKKIKAAYLQQGRSIDTAKESFCTEMKDTLADYEITDINETKIMDVI